MKREYIFKLRCYNFEEAEEQREETSKLLLKRLDKQHLRSFTTQCMFDPCNFENYIKIEIERDSLNCNL